MLTFEEAKDLVLAASGDPLDAEEVPLNGAVARVLAGPIQSALDLPPWDNSAMDGFAVRAADVADATPAQPVRLRVVGEVRAGSSPNVELPGGCAIRIATGARIPHEADAVIPVEETLAPAAGANVGSGLPQRAGFQAGEPLHNACLVMSAVQPGAYIRRRGEDVRVGARLLEPGRRMAPAQIALAAALGLGSIRVYRKPVAAVLSTGDELRSPGSELGESGIPDANGPGLLAMCQAAGAEGIDLGIAPDSLESVLEAIRPAIERADLLIVSGGVSVGPYDVVRMAFEAVGQVEVWRVAVQPGKPFAFGRSEPRASDGRRVLMFGLPGNPVSALVTFDLFVRPALERLAGLAAPEVDSDRAITEERLQKATGRKGFLRVTVVRDEHGAPVRDAAGRLRVRQSGYQGSHVLSALAAADALAVVPLEVDRLEPGAEVEIRWLRR